MPKPSCFMRSRLVISMHTLVLLPAIGHTVSRHLLKCKPGQTDHYGMWCVDCPVGYYSNLETLKNISVVGQSMIESMRFQQCKYCPVGKFSPPSVVKYGSTECRSCPVGYYGIETKTKYNQDWVVASCVTSNPPSPAPWSGEGPNTMRWPSPYPTPWPTYDYYYRTYHDDDYYLRYSRHNCGEDAVIGLILVVAVCFISMTAFLIYICCTPDRSVRFKRIHGE
jgi:hypothetical protein